VSANDAGRRQKNDDGLFMHLGDSSLSSTVLGFFQEIKHLIRVRCLIQKNDHTLCGHFSMAPEPPSARDTGWHRWTCRIPKIAKEKTPFSWRIFLVSAQLREFELAILFELVFFG